MMSRPTAFHCGPCNVRKSATIWSYRVRLTPSKASRVQAQSCRCVYALAATNPESDGPRLNDRGDLAENQRCSWTMRYTHGFARQKDPPCIQSRSHKVQARPLTLPQAGLGELGHIRTPASVEQSCLTVLITCPRRHSVHPRPDPSALQRKEGSNTRRFELIFA